MPRFVLLRHELPPDAGAASHWDLMLERGGTLLTWQLFELPSAWGLTTPAPLQPPSAITAARLSDHRLAYLDYEGPVSGGRGVVMRVASGEYRLLAEDDRRLDIELGSGPLRGRLQLTLESNDSWRLNYAAPSPSAKERSPAT